MRILPALLFIVSATPAFAQFPPPGAYACSDGAGKTLGTLVLSPAGDYTWTVADGTSTQGQVTSSGLSVRAISGVLLDAFHLAGTFGTNELGETTFAFESDVGPMTCGPVAG